MPFLINCILNMIPWNTGEQWNHIQWDHDEVTIRVWVSEVIDWQSCADRVRKCKMWIWRCGGQLGAAGDGSNKQMVWRRMETLRRISKIIAIHQRSGTTENRRKIRRQTLLEWNQIWNDEKSTKQAQNFINNKGGANGKKNRSIDWMGRMWRRMVYVWMFERGFHQINASRSINNYHHHHHWRRYINTLIAERRCTIRPKSLKFRSWIKLIQNFGLNHP